MNINTDTHYLFRMTNMEDEHKHRYTLVLRFRMTNMEDEDDKHRYTLLIQDDNKMTLQDMEDEDKQIHTTYSG